MIFNHSVFFVTIIIWTVFAALYYKYFSPYLRFDESLKLTLKQGKIVGERYKSALTGKEFYGFSGIPYAKPPTGELRFKAPEVHAGWAGILDAKKERNICLQFDFVKMVGNEDCLFINVYTPQLEKISGKSEILLPVMVFIHGGGFSFGSSSKDLYGPDFLINHGVIFVTFNYRLTIFGFLNLGIPDVPGNAGLKDQTLALKWVKDNIRSFGGDPDSITLFGQSAGAASVHYHMFSPLSKGLFQRSILQSGNAFCSWASTALTKEITNLLFKATGLDNKENVTTLANTLKSMNAQTLLVKAMDVIQQLKNMRNIMLNTLPVLFLPSEEEDIEGAFLPGKIEVLAKDAEPMPVMTGIDESEFLAFSSFVEKEFIYNSLSNNLPLVIQSLASDIKFTNETRKTAAEKIKEYYYGQEEVNDETLMETIDLLSDIIFNRPLNSFSEFTLQTTPVAYVYSFELKGDLRASEILKFRKVMNYPDKNVTVHGDEMGYLFHTSGTSKELLAVQENVDAINKMCTLWTNFAKTGDPNGNDLNRTWEATTTLRHSYLEIDKNMVTKNSRIFENRIAFWDKLKKKYCSP